MTAETVGRLDYSGQRPQLTETRHGVDDRCRPTVMLSANYVNASH